MVVVLPEEFIDTGLQSNAENLEAHADRFAGGCDKGGGGQFVVPEKMDIGVRFAIDTADADRINF